jgi:hypothetical protein
MGRAVHASMRSPSHGELGARAQLAFRDPRALRPRLRCHVLVANHGSSRPTPSPHKSWCGSTEPRSGVRLRLAPRSASRHGPNTHVASDATLKIIAPREIVFAKGGNQNIPPAVSRVVL